MLGGAIGDALGMPLESVPASTIRCSYPPVIRTYCDPVEVAPCHGFGLTGGMYTDDTQAVRATAIEIARSNDVSPLIIAEALSKWIIDDSLGQGHRYPGFTTLEAMRRYRETGNPLTCGVGSPTCGAAIRISPVALWLTLRDEPNFEARVRACAQVTHTAPSALDGAVLVAHLIRTGLRGDSPDIDSLLPLCQSEMMQRSLRRLSGALAMRESPDEVAEQLGSGSRAYEVVPMALYHLYSQRFSFREVLEAGLDTRHPSGLDMDSILSIAGALAGVRCPAAVENSQWLPGLETAGEITDEARALFASASAPS